MRKERAHSVRASMAEGESLTRTTCFLSEAQDYNLDVLALNCGKSKGTLIREGIAMVLRHYGLPEDSRVEFRIVADQNGSVNRNARNGGERQQQDSSEPSAALAATRTHNGTNYTEAASSGDSGRPVS
jgi:hypothetical protein